MSSASNFVTGVAVARVSGASEFGEYALVLTIWLFVVGVNRFAMVEPMIVDSCDTDAETAAIARGLGAEVVLGSSTSVLVAAAGLLTFAAGAHIGLMLLALSPWFVPLLVQDYWRAIAYQRRRPDLALVNDVTFAVVQVAAIGAFFLFGFRTSGHMIAAWGLGATAGALLGLRWFPTRAGWRAGWALICHLWPRGRWLLVDFATAFASQQGYVVFAALLLTNVDYGGYRAGLSLMGPTIVIMLAAGNIGFPEAARRAAAADRRELRRYVVELSFWTSCCVALYAVALAVAARHLLTVVYGEEFARFAVLTGLIGLQYVVMVSMFGQGIAVRATGWTRQLWPLRIPVLAASLGSLVLFYRWLGLIGVGWAGVATSAYGSLAIYLVYRRSAAADGDRAESPALPQSADHSLPGTTLPSDGASA